MINLQTIGTQIRQHRKARGLTLTELAEACEISTSFLSQVERDQANPSVATLYGIAKALNIPIASFFNNSALGNNNGAKAQQQPFVHLIQKDQRKVIVYPGSGIRTELLLSSLRETLQMIWIVMPPGTDSGEVPFVHEGEECGVILQGTIKTWVGDEVYILHPGDSIYHKSTIPHRSQNIGDDEVIMVVAKTSPSVAD